MEDIMQNRAATLDFGQSDFAVKRKARSQIDGRSGFNMQKSFRHESACSTDQQSVFLSGFFSSTVAASDAIDNVPVSASCTGKTGWHLPLCSKPRSVGERLHNRIEPKRQNGQSWNISTRHAHLVWKQMEKEAGDYLLPL